ncbi:MAG TPA: GTP 3',8-cyclase MoaA [Archaeoglobus profundus]|nr:GTP 3',8-cyclase MoaA [Archaeoglobus profundus]
MLIDRFGRVIKHLRLSVTSRCNLNCIYCHKEGDSSKDEMNVEEIEKICRAFYELGVRKIKITGGEPLIRDDIIEIIARMPPFDDISLVTNGTLLAKRAQELKEAGLNRINISLDTLKEDKYKLITGKRLLKRAIEGIYAAYDAGLKPIKLNMVILKGINDDEIDDLLNFASSFNNDHINVILQVIEVVGLQDYRYELSKIEERYEKIAEKVIVRELHNRKQYIFKNKAIEFVRPFHKEFCMHCTRIRVTCDGKIKPCLMKNDNLVNIRGLSYNELKKAIKRAVAIREPFIKN